MDTQYNMNFNWLSSWINNHFKIRRSMNETPFLFENSVICSAVIRTLLEIKKLKLSFPTYTRYSNMELNKMTSKKARRDKLFVVHFFSFRRTQ